MEPLAILTPEQIKTIVREAFAGQHGSEPDACMTLKEAASFLSIKPEILSRLAHAGQVPCRDLGLGEKANFRFSKRALSEWLAGQND